MTEAKDPREGHRGRLRKKFIEHGLEKFTDEEIVELLLTLGTPRRDCKQPPRDLMKRFKSIRAVMEADGKELQQTKGVGESNAFGIKLIHGVTRKFLRDKMLEAPALHGWHDLLDYLNHSMATLDREVFRIIYLSAADEVLDEEAVAVGTVSEVPVTPQQIVERAVRKGAAGIMVAHNHPGGKARPSQEDKELTKELLFLCRMMKLQMREHLIIAGDDHFSFSQEGMLAEYEAQFDKQVGRLFK